MKQRFLLLILLLLILLSACRPAPSDKDYGVFIGALPEDADRMKGYSTLVIDADLFSKEDIAALRQKGCGKIYSYLNIGALEDFRPAYEELSHLLLGVYEDWPSERWADVSQKEWREYILHKAEELSAKEIDGFFLDNADVYYHYPTPAIYEGLLSILRDLQDFSLPLILNGGDFFLSASMDSGELGGLLFGVNQETVFSSIDFSSRSFGRQSEEDRRYFLDHLARCKAFGLSVFLTEYTKESALKREIESYCRSQGFHFYISSSIELIP